MALLLFAFWVILNGRLTWEIALLGAGITALGMLFMIKECDWSLKREWGLYRAAPRIILYCLIVIREIIKANLSMFPVVYGGKPDPVIRTMRTKLKTRLGKMVLANCITLTPGTITVQFQGDDIVVHCLTPKMAEGLEAVEQNIFEKKLLAIEEALHG